jgi:hypothetical protein
MQNALQQVFREKDAAFREKETENAFSETPVEAKSGGMRQVMVLVTLSKHCFTKAVYEPLYGSKESRTHYGKTYQVGPIREAELSYC